MPMALSHMEGWDQRKARPWLWETMILRALVYLSGPQLPHDDVTARADLGLAGTILRTLEIYIFNAMRTVCEQDL